MEFIPKIKILSYCHRVWKLDGPSHGS